MVLRGGGRCGLGAADGAGDCERQHGAARAIKNDKDWCWLEAQIQEALRCTMHSRQV